MPAKKIQIYDTTMRDGAQAEGVALSVDDKLRLAKKLDALNIDFIEGGWPGSNPKDTEFFERMQKVKLRNAQLVAFGSTRKTEDEASDPILKALLASQAKIICLFGKTWDLHVRKALKITLDENLAVITKSVAFFTRNKRKVFFDAEHFFDGYKANPSYAMACLRAAVLGGAQMLVLCDTNGGSLPDEVSRIVSVVRKKNRVPVGIHCHNDAELAVANTLAAVNAGAIQVQGTMNGIGERCGNANLVSVIAGLELKLKYKTIGSKALKLLTETSRFVDQILNRVSYKQHAYVGESAFAHKGGVHVSAVMRDSKTYEHIQPEKVGNGQRILLSDYSGKATIVSKLASMGIELSHPIDEVRLLEEIKEREMRGYKYEDAEASFAMIVYRAQKGFSDFFELEEFTVTDALRSHDQVRPVSRASVRIKVKGVSCEKTAEGVGPVNALDAALRQALGGFYPHLESVRLVDYKVRVLASGQGTESVVRVHIEFAGDDHEWCTVGVSPNIIQASYEALVDGIEYHLIAHKKK